MLAQSEKSGYYLVSSLGSTRGDTKLGKISLISLNVRGRLLQAFLVPIPEPLLARSLQSAAVFSAGRGMSDQIISPSTLNHQILFSPGLRAARRLQISASGGETLFSS